MATVETPPDVSSGSSTTHVVKEPEERKGTKRKKRKCVSFSEEVQVKLFEIGPDVRQRSVVDWKKHRAIGNKVQRQYRAAKRINLARQAAQPLLSSIKLF